MHEDPHSHLDDAAQPRPPEEAAARLAEYGLDSEFIRTFIEQLAGAFLLIDPQTRQVVYANSAFAKIWQLPADAFVKDPLQWQKSVHPDDRERCMNLAMERIQNPDRTYPRFEYRIVRSDGIRWVRTNLFYAKHPTAGLMLYGIADDVTEEKLNLQAQAEAKAILEEEVRRRTAELTAAYESLQAKERVLEKTLHVQEWERKLVAFEIHDFTIQNVVAARMHVEAAGTGKQMQSQQKKLAAAAELLRTAVDESRRVINGMRPQTLDVLGLRAAVEELLARHEIDGLQVDLNYDLAGARISPMIETTLYRLIQETLTNVHRHADVPTAQLQLRRDGDHVVLRVADQGRGYDPVATKEKEFGLSGLRERARSVGGEVTIDAVPERGVTVTVRLPLLDPLDAAKNERDLTAAALELSRERFEQILDKTSAVVFVKDYEGRYEFVNHEHTRMFRLGLGSIIGKTDYDILPKEVADAVTENDRAALKSPTPIRFEETVPEDGVMRDFITVKFAVPGEHGKPPSVCGIATDITDQKRQIRRLEEAKHQFQAFMDHSPILAWIKDAEFRYVFMNKRMLEIFSLTPETAYGRTDLEIFPERWAVPVHEHDVEVLRTGETHRYREYCPIGNGEPLAWESCKFRLQSSDGKYLVAGVALDVSASVEADQYGVPPQ